MIRPACPAQIIALPSPDQIFTDLHVRDVGDILCFTAVAVADALNLPMKLILDPLQERESLASTAIGSGIALPHAAVAELHGLYSVFIRLRWPVYLGAEDLAPVDLLYICLFEPKDQLAGMQRLAKIAARLTQPGLQRAIRRADRADQISLALTGKVTHS